MTGKEDWRSGQIEEMRAQAATLRKKAEGCNQEASQVEARIKKYEREQEEEEARGNIARLAIMCADCQAQYEDAFQEYMSTFKACTDDELWPFVGKLGTRIEYWRVDGGCDPVKRAIDNVFWDILDMANWSMESWEQCARLAVGYGDISDKLHQHCHEMKGVEKSDDSYGDWTDCLPLAGEPVVQGILSDDIATYKQVEAALKEHRPAGLVDFIQNGENYIRGALDKVLREFFVNAVRHAGKKDDEE